MILCNNADVSLADGFIQNGFRKIFKKENLLSQGSLSVLTQQNGYFAFSKLCIIFQFMYSRGFRHMHWNLGLCSINLLMTRLKALIQK